MISSGRRAALRPQVWTPPEPPARARRRRSEVALPAVHVLPVPGRGPEDVLLTPDADVLTGLDDGRLLRVTPGGLVTEVARTGGRPLGLEWLPDGRVLVCDAARGLLAVDVLTSRMEVLVDSCAGAPFAFCNNAAVASDGSVYFSDSSGVHGVREWRGVVLEHVPDGRLLRWHPADGVDVVCDGLQFPNGVALATDESWVAVAQTGAYTVERVQLTGPDAGRRSRFVDLPGFPDNLSTGTDGLVWAAIASPRNSVVDALHRRPPRWRRAVWTVPQSLQPRAERTTWVMAFDDSGAVVHDLQDDVDGFHMCTGVREQDGTVWLGSLDTASVAWFDLEVR